MFLGLIAAVLTVRGLVHLFMVFRFLRTPPRYWHVLVYEITWKRRP